MKIVTVLMGTEKETTLDSLLDNKDAQDLCQFTIRKQEHRDFFEGYCLVRGVRFELVDWDKTTGGLYFVEITFPELNQGDNDALPILHL